MNGALYDIDILFRGYAQQRGIRLTRPETLNASPEFIAALAGVAGVDPRSACVRGADYAAGGRTMQRSLSMFSIQMRLPELPMRSFYELSLSLRRAHQPVIVPADRITSAARPTGLR